MIARQEHELEKHLILEILYYSKVSFSSFLNGSGCVGVDGRE